MTCISNFFRKPWEGLLTSSRPGVDTLDLALHLTLSLPLRRGKGRRTILDSGPTVLVTSGLTHRGGRSLGY